MYHKILVAVDNSASDEPLLRHVGALAARLGSQLLLLHVADGFAARHFEQLKLAESEEMKEDRDYLERQAALLRAQKLTVTTELALGNPPQAILRVAEASGCDLIAMATHGHKLVGDILHGSTIDRVRHNTDIPLLIIAARRRDRKAAARNRPDKA